MNEETHFKHIIVRIENLRRQRKEILALPPEKALERILDARQPAALVHSFPEEDLYFLIHDIGPEDSLPLLSLASEKQCEYILDTETWEKDRIKIRSVTRWMDLFLKSDPNRFMKWFLDKKTEFIEFYLFKNIEVRIRGNDQDPSDFGDDFFTCDDTFYIRLLDHRADDTIYKEYRKAFLSKFLKILAAYDHVKYQQVLLEASSVIPAESEEEAYRLRNVRLAEKGFLPFDEAIGIYQPLSPLDLEKQSTKFVSKDSDRDLQLPVPLYPAGLLKEDDLFTRSLKRIEIDDDIMRQIQTEFASLSNQVVAADQKKIREREELRTIVEKACGYISIGLERLTCDYRKTPGRQESVSCALIKKYPLSQIFRVGYGLALELKWQAQKWRDKSWFSKLGLPLSFWGEEWLGVLGGLLIKKPLFFDNYKTGVLYREFASIYDISETEKILKEIISFDDLLSLMTIRLEPVSDRFLTHKKLLLTLWARHYLGLAVEPNALIPFTLDEFKRFFNDLFTGEKKPRKTSLAMKESFLNWISDQTGLDPYEISQRVGQTLENLFNEIESEYGEVAVKDLDPRYIHLFLVKNQN